MQAPYWTQLVASTYEARAQAHRPGSLAIAAEVRRLAASGLKARDIAQALRLDIAQVINLARQQSTPV